MLNGLKEKPDYTKKKVALIVAGICSVLIFVVWIKFTISEAKNALNDTGEKGSEFVSKIKEGSSTFYKNISSQFGSIKNRFAEIKKYQEAGVAESFDQVKE